MANLPNAWMDKTVVALLSLTAVLCVISYNGQICDGQIVCKWIAFGITFCFFIILISECLYGQVRLTRTLAIYHLVMFHILQAVLRMGI